MKKIQKVSLASMIGSSIFVADNVFRVDGSTASALTQETSDTLRAQRAAKLTPVISLLLLDENEIAVDDSYTAQLNTLFSVGATAGVLANDNGLLSPTLMLLQDVNNGSLVLSPDGSFEYLPNIDFTGSDSFTYRLTTSEGKSDDATVSIRVNGTPDAIDDNFNLPSSAAFQDNVIINIVGGSDVIFDGAQVVEVVNQATALGGTVSIQANGDFQYTPPVDLANRQDSFVYTLTDNDGETDTATITWQVGVNFTGLETPFSVLENQTLESQFTITAPSGLQSLEVNGTSFTLAELNASSPGASLSVINEQFGEFSITGFNETTGVLNFAYDPTGTSQNHSMAIEDKLSEVISISAIDVGIATPFDTNLQIDVLDTSPIATDDTRSISEGTSAIAGNTVGTLGAAPDDNQDTLTDANASPVTGVSFAGTSGTVGTNLSGGFGSFVINSAGVYTYTLDNTSTDVQGLKSGDSLTDVFTYTITDGDGDTDSANVLITINGVEDALPTIVVTDANGPDAGQQEVDEGSGSGVSSSVTVGGATAGLAMLTVSGQDVINASSEPVTITGSEGVLEVTSFDAGSGVFSYTYTEDGAANDHSAGQISDQYTIIASDNEGDTDTDTLTIIIDDTQPSATADSNSITEDAASNTVSGDLLQNDTTGADTPITVNDISVGSSQQLAGTYGRLLLDASGTYSYTMSNEAASVQDLRTGDSLTDVFSYILTDADDSSSSSQLTVTILGQDEPPVVTIPDNNSDTAGDASVAENANTTGSFVVTAESGLATTGVALQLSDEQNDQLSLTLTQLQNLSTSNQSLVGVDGTITLTGYSNSGDVSTISYGFDPTGTNRDHSAGDESVVEMFSIVATDDLSRSAPVGVLDILITDTAPTAAADTNNVTEDSVPNVAVGDVITNDTAGADTAISVVGVDLNGLDLAPTVGTPFDSDYGSLDLNSDGTYTYTLDNNNSAVQNLDSGQSLVETFSYTIEDTDGDTSTTGLTITINGANEPPSVAIPDANGAGVVGDVSVAENLTTTGAFVVSAENGLAASGTALQITDEQSDTLSLTLAQLQNLSAANQVASSDDGTLTLNGYANAADDHTITFSFDPTNANRDHSGGLDSVVDMFSIVATDQSGQSSVAEVLDILITDTPPTANNDGRSISEGTSAISGNAVGGLGSAAGDVQDTLVDANATPVIDVDFGTTDGTVGSNLLGGFGSFVINSAGVYTYTLDNTSTDVQGLKGGESIIDVFTYTIQDGDGSTDSANISVTINGVEDATPIITLADANGMEAGQQSVIEASGDSASGTLTVTASAGVKTLTIGGQDVRNATAVPVTITGSDGALEVTSYSSGTGIIEYTYNEDQTSDDHSTGPVTDQFFIALIDNEDDGASDILTITINDTDATAFPDSESVMEDAVINVITGNVFDNDTGADSRTLTQFTFSGASQTLGALVPTLYGEFTLSSGGNFTYTLDNSDLDTNLLNTGDMVTEIFSYTLTDLDGDTSSSTLSITINGVDDV